MYEIKQELGFEVKDALAALENLDKGFGTFGMRLETNVLQLHAWNTKADVTLGLLQKIQSAAAAAASAFSGIRMPSDDLLSGKINRGGQTTGLQGGAAAKQMNEWIENCQKAGGAAAATEQALASVGKTGSNAINNVTLSWKTMLRVMETQALIRGFNMVRNAVEEAYTSFQSLSKAVGEIAAINPERNFAQITDSVHKMSDAFNQPIGRVAEAQYQLLSSQFTTDADRVNILTAANKLAKAGAQDLGDTTLLLVGALNAYGDTSDKAALRAAEFFETIKLGRLRAGELGTALGRIQGIAHELGVSIEELNASLVAITIGGVKVTEASTQMRGIMSSLLKPSEELKKAFKDIGVESGPAAVATYGLKGTLDALWKSIDGNKSLGAKIFPNVRAMAGDFRLAGEGAEKFKATMDAQTNLDRDTLNKPFEQFVQTDAEKLNKELNKLSNFFTADFGQRLVAQLNGVVQALGGGKGLLGTLQILTGELPRDIAIVGGLIAVFKALSLASFSAGKEFTTLDSLMAKNSASMTRYFGTLKGIVGTLALFEAAKIGGEAIGNWYGNTLRAPQEAVRDQAARELEVQNTKTEASVRLAESQGTRQFQVLRQYVAKANVEYLRDADNFKLRAKDIEKDAQTSFDKVLSTRQKLTQELGALSATAWKNAESVPDTTAKLLQDVADRRYKREAMAGADPLGEYQNRLRDVVDQYKKLQGGAKDDREQKLADAAWDRVLAWKALVQQQEKLIGGSFNLEQIARLEDDLDQRKVEAMEAYQRTQEQVAKDAEERQHVAEAHNAELSKLRLKIEDELKSTVKDEGGVVEFKDSATFARDLKAAESDTKTFLARMKEYGKDFSADFLADPRAFEAMKRETERALASAHLQNIELAPEALAKLNAQMSASVAKLRVEVPAILKLEQLTGEDIRKVGLQKVLDDASAKYISTLTQSAQAEGATKKIAAGRAEYEKGMAAFKPLFDQPATAWGGLGARSDPDQYRKAVDAVNQMKELAAQTSVTHAEALNLQTALNRINWDKVFPSTAQSEQAYAAIQTMLDGINTMSEQTATAPSAAAQGAAQEIQRILEGMGNTKTATEDAARASRDFTSSLERAATIDLTALVNGLSTVGGAMFNMSSGAAHYASGGMGTDTTPAMLSRGEFVMNAASTRRFYSQLTAMNAGGTPSDTNQGVSVTNIGDVSITIPGSSSPQATAQAVAEGLRRMSRMGRV